MQMAESLQDVQEELKELKAEANKAKSDGNTALYLALRVELGSLRATYERLAGENIWEAGERLLLRKQSEGAMPLSLPSMICVSCRS